MEAVVRYLCCIWGVLKGTSQLNSLYANLSNPVTVPAAGSNPLPVLAANPDRKQLTIHVNGTAPVAVQYGTPGATVYILTGSGTANDGTGGTETDEIWKGVVYLVGTGSASDAIVNELV